MFRVGTTQKQETFLDDRSAFEFKRLVETVGGEAALRVLAARQSMDDGMPTLREWTAKYLDQDSGLLTGIEPGTRAGYETIAERSFLKVLGDFPVDAVGKPEVGRWLAWQEKQPSSRSAGKSVSAKTIRNYHAVLSSVLASAVDHGLRPDNPAYRTRLTEGTRREGVFLTPDEFATILHFIPHYYEGLFVFLAGTGCRWGEATAITWADLNLRSHPATVRINKAWKKGPTSAPILKQPKSRKARRTISITDDTVAALGTPGRADELVFRGRQSGTHLWYGSTRYRVWEPAVAKARDAEACAREGLEPIDKTPTIHDLRHSHASWLIAAGVPLPNIQTRLGHEKITTTVDVYGHLAPEAHQQMADVIAHTLTGIRPLRQLSPA